MRILLDTHVWVWSQESPEELGSIARSLLMDMQNEVFVSSISTLEIARMVADGRIVLVKELGRWVREGIEMLGAMSLHVDDHVAMEAYKLAEPFHQDPADRILVATARVQDCAILTADRLILKYEHVRSFDARA